MPFLVFFSRIQEVKAASIESSPDTWRAEGRRKNTCLEWAMKKTSPKNTSNLNEAQIGDNRLAC